MKKPTIIASVLFAALVGGTAGRYLAPPQATFLAVQKTADADMLELAQAAKYVPALRKITGIYDDAALANKANETGLSEALINMIHMARNGIPSNTTPPVVQPPSTVPPGDNSTAFVSLHQISKRTAKSADPVHYTYEFVHNTGFRSQYNPDDPITGCEIGALASGQCGFPFTTPGQVALSSSEKMVDENGNVPDSFKFYVPPGLSQVTLLGWAPQRTAYAYAIRMNQLPQRTQGVNANDYLSIQRGMNVDSSFPRLAKGDEILTVHDGGGTILFLGGSATSSGGWVYVRKLPVTELVHTNVYVLQPADALYRAMLTIQADKATFVNHYKQISWKPNGDPQ